RHTGELFFATFLAGGSFLLILLTLQRLPTWLSSPGGLGWPEPVVAPVVIAGHVWEVACWLLLGLLLLAGPIAVIEERSFPRVIGEWWGLVRRHAGRVVLYETIALLLGLLVSAPFLVPVLLTNKHESGTLGVVSQCTAAILGGLALAPCLGYVLVAYVFIY